ncbi:MAG: hypothetical protein ACI9V1_002115, partial [Spirosomataceae bacterium]
SRRMGVVFGEFYSLNRGFINNNLFCVASKTR